MISNQQVWIKDQKEKLKLAREIPYLSLCLIPMAQPKQIISKITFRFSKYIKGLILSKGILNWLSDY